MAVRYGTVSEEGTFKTNKKDTILFSFLKLDFPPDYFPVPISEQVMCSTTICFERVNSQEALAQ